MSRYTSVAGADREKAVRLYTWNTAVSAAFYGPLQGLEGIVNLLGKSRGLDELDGEQGWWGYAARVMPQTSCHASKARPRSAR
jgi:hypothetical protein